MEAGDEKKISSLYVKISRIEKRNPAYEKKISQNKPDWKAQSGLRKENQPK